MSKKGNAPPPISPASQRKNTAGRLRDQKPDRLNPYKRGPKYRPRAEDLIEDDDTAAVETDVAAPVDPAAPTSDSPSVAPTGRDAPESGSKG